MKGVSQNEIRELSISENWRTALIESPCFHFAPSALYVDKYGTNPGFYGSLPYFILIYFKRESSVESVIGSEPPLA